MMPLDNNDQKRSTDPLYKFIVNEEEWKKENEKYNNNKCFTSHYLKK